MEYVGALVDGVLIGCLFAGVAVGLSLIFGISNLLNLAHGAFIVLGAYLAYALQQGLGIHPFLALPLVGCVGFGLGWLIYRAGGLARIARGPLLMVIVFTFALDLIIVNLITMRYSGTGRSLDLPQFMYGSWEIAGVIVPTSRVLVAIAAIAIVVLINVFIKRTKIGRAIRATRLDREMASLNGVSVTATYAIAFGIGSAAAAVAGVLLAYSYPFQPGIGVEYLIISFAVAIIAGLGRIDGVILGGVFYGVVLSEMSLVLGSGTGRAAAFSLLFVFLLIRPQGMFGSDYY